MSSQVLKVIKVDIIEQIDNGDGTITTTLVMDEEEQEISQPQPEEGSSTMSCNEQKVIKVDIIEEIDNGDGTITTTFVMDEEECATNTPKFTPCPVKDFKYGLPVWAKVNYFKFWPGVIDVPQEGMVQRPWLTRVKKQVVYFFGFLDYLWVDERNIIPYQGQH